MLAECADILEDTEEKGDRSAAADIRALDIDKLKF